jgi:hypothetical protein
MAEGKDKDKKKWYTDNVDSEDLDSVLEEEFEDHGDLDSDGMDDGNLGIRGSYGRTNRSPYSPWRDRALDPKDEYTFREEEDEHLRGTPSIAAFVNGDGLLNSDNILRKSSIVEDVENVLAVKASNVDEIGTKKEMSPTHSLSKKGHMSGGGKDGEVAKKTTADVSLTVRNAYVKEESDVEKLDPISSTGAMLGEGNSFGRGQRSSMNDCPSRALFGSSSKNVELVKLGSSRGLVSLSKKVHPRIKNGDGCTSESDRDIPIGTVFKRNPACPPPHKDGLSHGKQLQALTKIKREPIGGPKSGRTGPIAVSQQKRKSPMQPFARLPLNTKGRPKTPLDGRCKRAKYGSIQERVRGICTKDDSSNDEREESDSPDSSSGVEVKRDDDYSLGD